MPFVNSHAAASQSSLAAGVISLSRLRAKGSIDGGRFFMNVLSLAVP